MSAKNWNPEKVLKTHVREAAKMWTSEGGFLNFKNSISYDVIIDGKPYPPKAISSSAHFLATGAALTPGEFGGAKDGLWHRRLKELGFTIVEKGGDFALSMDVSKSMKLSQNARLKKIAEQTKEQPEQIEVRVTRYVRSSHVVAERLFQANGTCERCKLPAPFRRIVDDTPYLEVHHIKPLSEGGLDTVENTQALCPNCHSEIHDRLRMDRQVE